MICGKEQGYMVTKATAGAGRGKAKKKSKTEGQEEGYYSTHADWRG